MLKNIQKTCNLLQIKTLALVALWNPWERVLTTIIFLNGFDKSR